MPIGREILHCKTKVQKGKKIRKVNQNPELLQLQCVRCQVLGQKLQGNQRKLDLSMGEGRI